MDQENRIMLVEQDIRIKAYEIDAMGVVSNIEYVKYFEDLRHVFLDEFYPYDQMMKSHISPVLMNTDIHYKIPLTIHDKPRGRCWVTKMKMAKWELAFEIESTAGMHCVGTQKGGFFDVQEKKPIRCPESLLERYRRETGAVSAT